MTSEFLSINANIQEISGGKVVSFEKIRYGWIAVIVLGLSMFYIQNLVDPDNGAPTMALITLGLAMAVIGVWKVLSKETVYMSGSCRLSIKEADFDLSDKGEVLRCFVEGDYHHLSGLSCKSAAKIKIRFLCNQAFSIVYAQPFCYQPYDYFPCAEARLLSENQAQEAKEMLRIRKN